MANYQAAWAPGLSADFDRDEAIDLAIEWVRGVKGVRNRFAVTNVNNPGFPTGGLPYRSYRSRMGVPAGPNAIVAFYPSFEALQVAENWAGRGGALCVIPGTLDDVTGWIMRTNAVNLAEPGEALQGVPRVHAEVVAAIDSVCFFDGHNNFGGAGGQEAAVRGLQQIIASGHPVTGADIETLALANPKLRSPDGAKRLREWFEALKAGKRLKDHGGRYL